MAIVFRQVTITYLVLASVIQIIGHLLESGFQPHHRSKRATYSCSSVTSLKKFLAISGHTACINPAGNADLLTAGVTEAEKIEIVTEHNNYRRTESASDMMEMSWDEEIAFIAQKWAENCQTDHESPGYKRSIPGRFSLGQNLAWNGGKMTWTKSIKLWYDEISLFTYNSDSNVLHDVGHYTQVVWAKSIKVGCGYAQCGGTHLYVCNYGPAGNANIKTPFTQGSKCGDCSSHCNNNLCSCNLVCLNGGTLDISTCTCTCSAGYSSPDCSLDCDAKTDPGYCASTWGVSKCPTYSNVPPTCPHMCGFCPNAGIAVTGQTDGKGNVPFRLTDGGGGYGSGSNSNQYTGVLIVISIFSLLCLTR